MFWELPQFTSLTNGRTGTATLIIDWIPGATTSCCWTELPRTTHSRCNGLGHFWSLSNIWPCCPQLPSWNSQLSIFLGIADSPSASEAFSVSSGVSSSLAFCPPCSIIYHCHQWAISSTSSPSFIHSTNIFRSPPRHVAFTWTTAISLHKTECRGDRQKQTDN